MADVSKINVNGTGYNVKDATARTAASNAQTTANGKLSDAPSDGKQYARQDGAWVEVEATGSGVPAGGTIGQVLVKNSSTDGDAGWYNWRNRPTDKWYLPDGIVEEDVVAAYQFVGADDEASALININDGTLYGLSKANSNETWSVTKGFYIPGLSNSGLLNFNLQRTYQNWLSVAFGYSGLDASKSSGPGIMPASTKYIDQRNNKQTVSYNGNAYYTGNSASFGVLSVNFTSPPAMYRNGTNLSLSATTPETNGRNKLFGVRDLETTTTVSSIYVTAIAIYNIVLDVTQHLQLANNIIALGGIQ